MAISYVNTDSHFWRCIDHTSGNAGTLYYYTPKEAFDFVHANSAEEADQKYQDSCEKTREILPALELFASQALFFQENLTQLPTGPAYETDYLQHDYEGAYRYAISSNLKLCRALGFLATRDENQRLELQVPDAVEVLHNWKQLQRESRLPDLHIFSCSGILSDLNFIQAHLSHDVIYSEGAERIHDAFFHLIPRISLIHDCVRSGGVRRYAEENARVKKIIQNNLEIIQWASAEGHKLAAALLFSLTAVIDFTSSVNCYRRSLQIDQPFIDRHMSALWDPHYPLFQHPIRERFPDISQAEIREAWQEIKTMEAVAKLLCPEKSMILRPIASGGNAATLHSTRSAPSGPAEENGCNEPRKDDFNGQMSFATASTYQKSS